MVMIKGRGRKTITLEALEAEAAGLPAAIAAATRTGDDARLSALLMRERQLPIQIADIKSEALRRRIAEIEGDHAAAVAAEARAMEDERQAREARDRAERAYHAERHNLGAAQRQQERAKIQRKALERQLDALRADLATQCAPQ